MLRLAHMASEMSGWGVLRRYEGTGRSLSLKLLQQLRAEGAILSIGDAKKGAAAEGGGAGGRTFREVQLQEPIR